MNQKKKKLPDIPVMILCGGKGTRLRDVTEVLPKPMVPIGTQPILWHIMKSYAVFGVKRFILCLGYKSEAFIDFFMNFHLRISDATITLGHDPEIHFHQEVEESDWQVTLAQTGIETKTGLRVARAARYLKDSDRDFFLTYGDGVSDIDLAELYQAHKKSGKLLTVSAVHPPARFGEMILDGDTVTEFDEKVSRGNGYINGGFMVMKRDFLSRYLSLERDEFLEQAPILRCVEDRQTNAFRHEGFWQCMDTPREFTLLNEFWSKKKAPWTKYWEK
jgi:glucose-1-phosphate cytidylyltransferase